MIDSKSSLVRTHLGTLALAFAILFAAGVFGFVSSKAFAIFFLCFVGSIVFAGIGLAFLSAAGEVGWISGIVAGMFLLMAVAGLIGGIKEALDAVRSGAPAAATALRHQ